jgi:hypothetical protein
VSELFEGKPSSACDRCQRVIWGDDGETGARSQELVETPQQGAAAHQGEAAAGDVREELGWCPFEGEFDAFNDLGEGTLEGAANRVGVNRCASQEARDKVGAGDTCDRRPASLGDSGADLELDRFRLLLPDQQSLAVLQKLDDRVVEVVAADSD